MIMNRYLLLRNILLYYFFGIIIYFQPLRVNAQTNNQIELPKKNTLFYNIQQSDENGVIVEFIIPKPICTSKEKEFHIITIPGCCNNCEAGKPQLPFNGYLLGIPPGTKPELEILDFDFSILPNYNICPAPKVVIKHDLNDGREFLTDEDVTYEFFLDKSIYSNNHFYPDQIAKTGDTGFIRDQCIGNFQIFPVQFNPVSNEIRWYKRIKLKISFLASSSKFKSPASQINTSEPFEKILSNSLLNYQAAKFWKRTPTRHHRFKSINKPNMLQFLGAWYKILIEEDGIYIIDKKRLEEVGFYTATTDPKKIRIFNRGNEIPIYVKGQEDGIFDVSDYIEFYGIKIKNDYTYTNVYWLTVDESIDGLRMLEQDGSIIGTEPVLTKSKENIRFEQENYYSTSIPNGEGVDHWFWDYIIAPDSKNFTVPLDNVANMFNDDCLIKVEYRGFSNTFANPDHHTILSLNGYQLLNDKWDGQIQFNSQTMFPHSYLTNGTNTISVNLPGETESNTDIIYINWFEIEYWRNYMAQQDSLIFWAEGAGTHQLELSNFSNNNVELFDITDISNLKRITNFSIESTQTSNKVIFQDDLNGKQRYYALTEDKRKVPITIIADDPSQLQSELNQADYIIITHEEFYDEVATLANFRQSQGLNVMTIKLADIYDEFNNGIKNPIAIKDFLAYSYYNWQKPAPTYILLVGDASYDYKDHLKTGNKDYVPTHLFESVYYNTETSSDISVIPLDDF